MRVSVDIGNHYSYIVDVTRTKVNWHRKEGQMPNGLLSGERIDRVKQHKCLKDATRRRDLLTA